MTSRNWIAELDIKAVPLSEWRVGRSIRDTSNAACNTFLRRKDTLGLEEASRQFLATPVLEPQPRDVLLEECWRDRGRSRGISDVLCRPIHFLGWAAAVLLYGPTCAIDGCGETAFALDHDQIEKDGTGLMRGLLCKTHNSATYSPSGPNAHLKTKKTEMKAYLETPPMAWMNIAYVGADGFPDGWKKYEKARAEIPVKPAAMLTCERCGVSTRENLVEGGLCDGCR